MTLSDDTVKQVVLAGAVMVAINVYVPLIDSSPQVDISPGRSPSAWAGVNCTKNTTINTSVTSTACRSLLVDLIDMYYSVDVVTTGAGAVSGAAGGGVVAGTSGVTTGAGAGSGVTTSDAGGVTGATSGVGSTPGVEDETVLSAGGVTVGGVDVACGSVEVATGAVEVATTSVVVAVDEALSLFGVSIDVEVAD